MQWRIWGRPLQKFKDLDGIRWALRVFTYPEMVPPPWRGVVQPGQELMHLFASGRVLVERGARKSMAQLPSGRIPDAMATATG